MRALVNGFGKYRVLEHKCTPCLECPAIRIICPFCKRNTFVSLNTLIRDEKKIVCDCGAVHAANGYSIAERNEEEEDGTEKTD